MRNLFLSLAGVAIFILIVGIISKTNQGEKTILSPYWHPVNLSGSPVATATPNLKTLKIGNTNILVIVALDDATRSRGLGGVSNLPENQGMLFVFDSKQIRPSFWMKDMLIPLDFIWISNNKVAEITPQVPAPKLGTPDSGLTIYSPNEAIDYVLEVNAGFAGKNNIMTGDLVDLNHLKD